MLTLLAAFAFVIGLVTHEGGGDFLTLDWAGWLLLGLVLLAAGILFPWRPWRDRP